MAENRPARIGEEEFAQVRLRLAPISDSYLRRLLRGTGLPLAPLASGIVQDSFDQLEETLLAMEQEYSAAWISGDRERTRLCRRLVIQAKDHARFSLRRATADKHAAKEEMILWMLTWLENPQAFPTWLRLRKNVLP